jgi:hypothetical protein
MSRLARRTMFAAPLVVTALGCGGEKHATQPTPARDAAVVAKAAPDAKPAPVAVAYGWIEHQSNGICVWKEPFDCPPNAKCNPPEPRTVTCPDPKVEATLQPPPATGGNVFVRDDGSCWFSYADDCPPGDQCNPPPPDQVRCPTK